MWFFRSLKWTILHLVGVCTVCCAIAAGLIWLRSYWRYDFVIIGGNLDLHSVRGEVILSMSQHVPDHYWDYLRSHWEYGSEAFDGSYGDVMTDIFRPETILEKIGFGFRNPIKGAGPLHSQWLRSLPYWFLELIFGLPGFIYLKRLLRRALERRRVKAGLCTRCGYDLRASENRCPECGKSNLNFPTNGGLHNHK